MSNKELEKYGKRELWEQILYEPDTFVGGTDIINDNLPIINSNNTITIKDTDYIPAIGKLFDEILVNARDQKVRLEESLLKGEKNIIPVNNIKIEYNNENYMWTIYNDGNGIDVAEHPKEKDKNGKPIHIVELILGNLLTSKNYNKSGKTTGGKNGFGAKLVNLFSTYFRVETVDHIRGLKYIQEFTNNMRDKTKPKITKVKCKPYTKISWITDFNRFNIEKYSDDMINLMIRRIYDIAGTTDKNMNIFYNGDKIKVKTFENYAKLYLNKEELVYEKIHDRWEVGISTSLTDKFEQYAFVNGIYTSKGGKHVDLISKQLTSGITNYIKKKNKKDIPESYIKNYLKIFVNSVIEDPSFDSQSKERLITTQSKFGSKPIISDKLIKKIVDKLDIVDKVLSFADFKLTKEAKKTNGQKVNRIKNIPKLDDANWAGGKKSDQCTLILTEGDSAKTMAISGLSEIGRDKYGVFPLRGKLLNVKDASVKQILDNNEITNLKKIIGLEEGRIYDETYHKRLRYGHIMILTDQDHDGSHIKGLVLNVFHTLWPSLLKQKNFILSMITPIVKVSKGKKIISFYNLTAYNDWQNKTDDYKKWQTKYYKGLGTSTAKEAKEYFKSMKLNNYEWTDNSEDKMNLAFKKDLSDKRKEWLYKYDEDNVIDSSDKSIKIEQFVDNELIHFSNSDTLRSIGSLCDGLKPSQRKIMYCCFKRKLYKEIRVAQLAGYVSENAAYHHGEASLQSTIIGLGQDYVGSNNINLLKPNGQFGTRLMGGADAASPRYIHTELNPIVDYIYPSDDFPLLKYNDDDGILVEPKYYLPIIPTVLVNGMKGIGTGFSTSIPPYNPLDIIQNIIYKIKKQPYKDIVPWFNGFKGTIEKLNNNLYITKGIYNIISNDTLVITELPIGVWTQNYKEFLDSLLYDKTKKQKFYILDYEDHSSDTIINFKIKVEPHILKNITCNIKKNIDSIEELFKLHSSKNTSLTNIHLYNSSGTIKKYKNVNDIFDDYYIERYNLYILRKEYQLKQIKYELDVNNSKFKFINDVINENILIYRNKRENIINKLIELKYNMIIDKNITNNYNDINKKSGFNYLINMPLYNLTEEKLEELNETIKNLQDRFDKLNNSSIESIWLKELSILKKEYLKLK
jgi:DNA topoisomerase-2